MGRQHRMSNCNLPLEGVNGNCSRNSILTLMGQNYHHSVEEAVFLARGFQCVPTAIVPKELAYTAFTVHYS